MINVYEKIAGNFLVQLYIHDNGNNTVNYEVDSISFDLEEYEQNFPNMVQVGLAGMSTAKVKFSVDNRYFSDVFPFLKTSILVIKNLDNVIRFVGSIRYDEKIEIDLETPEISFYYADVVQEVLQGLSIKNDYPTKPTTENYSWSFHAFYIVWKWIPLKAEICRLSTLCIAFNNVINAKISERVWGIAGLYSYFDMQKPFQKLPLYSFVSIEPLSLDVGSVLSLNDVYVSWTHTKEAIQKRYKNFRELYSEIVNACFCVDKGKSVYDICESPSDVFFDVAVNNVKPSINANLNRFFNVSFEDFDEIGLWQSSYNFGEEVGAGEDEELNGNFSILPGFYKEPRFYPFSLMYFVETATEFGNFQLLNSLSPFGAKPKEQARKFRNTTTHAENIEIEFNFLPFDFFYSVGDFVHFDLQQYLQKYNIDLFATYANRSYFVQDVKYDFDTGNATIKLC